MGTWFKGTVGRCGDSLQTQELGHHGGMVPQHPSTVVQQQQVARVVQTHFSVHLCVQKPLRLPPAPRDRVMPKPQCPVGSGFWFQARQPDAAGGRSEGKQGVRPGMTLAPPPGGGRQLQVLL